MKSDRSGEDDIGSQVNDGKPKKDTGKGKSTFPKGKSKTKDEKSPNRKGSKNKEAPMPEVKEEPLPQKRFTLAELEAPARCP